MGKNARVKWKSRRKFSQSRTFHSYPIGLHIIFSTSSCAKLAVYLVWWVASFLFKFSDKVCDISNLCNFLTMHVAYLSIQFSDNACDISVNPFYANEWDIRFYFIYLLPLSPILESFDHYNLNEESLISRWKTSLSILESNIVRETFNEKLNHSNYKQWNTHFIYHFSMYSSIQFWIFQYYPDLFSFYCSFDVFFLIFHICLGEYKS